MLNPIHVKILSKYVGKALKSIHVSTEDKERLAEALGLLEQFPFYLVSITDEDLDMIRRAIEDWEHQAIKEQYRTMRFRMREIGQEAYYKAEYNRVLGAFRNARYGCDSQGEGGVLKYNLNEAKALAAQDRLVERYHGRWLLCKACRKESEIIAKAYQDAADSQKRAYHLAKDKAEGKLVAATGG